MKRYVFILFFSQSVIYSQSLSDSIESFRWDYPLTKKLSQTWDINQWKNQNQYLFSYDSNNKLSEWIFQYYTNENWKNEGKTVNQYNSFQQLVNSFAYYWSSDWILNHRITNTYDSLSNQIQSLNELWRNNDWVNFKRWIREFNENQMTVQISQRFEDSIWQNQFRYSYLYDSYGNNIEYIVEAWYFNNWKKSSKHTFLYNSNNNWIENEIYIWNNEWEPYHKYVRVYENENMVEEIEYYWLDSTNIYENTFKKKFVYEQSLLKEEYWSIYSDYLSTWQNYIMFNSNYNSYNYLDERLKYYWSNQTYNLSSREANFYNVPSNVEDDVLYKRKISIGVYPNPFNSSFKIRLNINAPQKITMYLYDIRGRRVKSLIDSFISDNVGEYEFYLDDLSSGVYLINLETNQQIVTEKLLYLK